MHSEFTEIYKQLVLQKIKYEKKEARSKPTKLVTGFLYEISEKYFCFNINYTIYQFVQALRFALLNVLKSV